MEIQNNNSKWINTLISLSKLKEKKEENSSRDTQDDKSIQD